MSTLRAEVNTARRELARYRCDRMILTYRRLRNEFNVARRVAKREHWRSFVSQSGGRDPFGFVTRSARELVPVETLLSTVRGEDGTQTESVEQTAEVILHMLFPDDTYEDDIDVHRAVRGSAREP